MYTHRKLWKGRVHIMETIPEATSDEERDLSETEVSADEEVRGDSVESKTMEAVAVRDGCARYLNEEAMTVEGVREAAGTGEVAISAAGAGEVAVAAAGAGDVAMAAAVASDVAVAAEGTAEVAVAAAGAGDEAVAAAVASDMAVLQTNLEENPEKMFLNCEEIPIREKSLIAIKLECNPENSDSNKLELMKKLLKKVNLNAVWMNLASPLPLQPVSPYWLKTFLNTPPFASQIEYADLAILAQLKEIILVTDMGVQKFALGFVFEDNDYFENEFNMLHKIYHVRKAVNQENRCVRNDVQICKSEGCKIKWKPGNNLTFERGVFKASFFHYFGLFYDIDAIDSKFSKLINRDFGMGWDLKLKLVPMATAYNAGTMDEF